MSTIEAVFQSPRNRGNISHAPRFEPKTPAAIKFQSPRNRGNISHPASVNSSKRWRSSGFNPLEIGATFHTPILNLPPATTVRQVSIP